MDHAAQLALVEELALSLHEEVKRQGAVLSEIQPALTREFTAFLAGRAAQLAAEHRATNSGEIKEQTAALRVELHKLAEEKMAQLWAREQGAIENIRGSLNTYAAELIGQKMTELAAQTGSKLTAFDTRLKEFAAAPAMQSDPGNPTGPLVPVSTALVSSFRGQWNAKLSLKAGELVAFRGSVLLAKRDVPAGVVPTRRNQEGANAYFALFVPAGAPGPQPDLTAIQQSQNAAAASATAAALSATAAANSAAEAATITGCGSGDFGGTVPLIGLTTATAAAATSLTLSGGSSGASLVLGQGNAGVTTIRGTTAGAASNNLWIVNNDFTLGSAGTLLRLGHGATTGDTYGVIDALDAGGTGSTHLVLQGSGGNVLIGGDSDITGSGGLKVFGTTAAASLTTGAFQCAGGGSFTKELIAGLGMWLVDGITAPSATVGFAKLFVDTSDGDLKIIFGDGTVKTISTDT
jgi:hypothetical protein